MEKFKIDRYGRKIDVMDETRIVEDQAKRKSIVQLFEEDEKRLAQKVDVVDDKREDLVVDANTDIKKYENSKGKEKSEAEDPDKLFDLSDNANTDKGKFDSAQKSKAKDDVKGDMKKSTDDRGEYVSESKADDKSAFESNQKKTKKINAVEQEVKARWSNTVHSMLFDPFKLNGSKKFHVAFKIGTDYVLMPSRKPTRTEWLTARSVVAELRDPAILRTAQMMEDEKLSGMDGAIAPMPEGEKVKTDMDLVTNMNESDMVAPEGSKEEEKSDVDCLKQVLDALNAGDIEEATTLLEECIAEEEEEEPIESEESEEKEEKVEEKVEDKKEVEAKKKADNSVTKPVNKADEATKDAKEIGTKKNVPMGSSEKKLDRAKYTEKEQQVTLD